VPGRLPEPAVTAIAPGPVQGIRVRTPGVWMVLSGVKRTSRQVSTQPAAWAGFYFERSERGGELSSSITRIDDFFSRRFGQRP